MSRVAGTLLCQATMIASFAFVAWLISMETPERPLVSNSIHNAVMVDPSEIPRLIARGHDVNKLDGDGHTALWIAARFDREGAVAQLLRWGADPDVAGPDTETPLLAATFLGTTAADETIVELLLKHGASPVARSPQLNETPLHQAASSGNLRIATSLLGHGAAMNAQDHRGDTPLQRAVVWGHPEIVELLLSNRADAELRNDAGFRPIDQLNATNKAAEIQTVFRAHGADDERREDLIQQFRKDKSP